MAELMIKEERSGMEACAPLGHGVVTLGRDDTNDIVLEYGNISRRHCQIEYSDEGCLVRDFGSRGGTYIGDERIEDEMPWFPGEELRIGTCRIRLNEPKRRIPADAKPGKAKPVADEKITEYKSKIREYLVEHPEVKRLIHTSADDAELRIALTDLIHEASNDEGLVMPRGLSEAALVKDLVDEILGLGPIEDLMRDETVTEIMVNRWNRILVERAGRGIETTDRKFLDEDHLLETVRRILAPLGRHLNESSPLVDARLSDGTRVNAVIPPISFGGCVMTIRKFSKQPFTLEKLTELKSITTEAAEMLRFAVRSRLNMIVSGGTGSGKTSFLNSLSDVVPPAERLVVIEDTHELRFDHANCVYLEARPPSLEGQGEITIRRLVINSLRMRPDRIIVGECRGDESFDMLQAMNTGHLGSMTTVHANSPRDAILRIENMTLMAGYDLPAAAIRRQVVSAINVIVQLTRFGEKGERRVSCISEVTGTEGNTVTMQDLYRMDERGRLRSTGTVPRFLQTLPNQDRARLIRTFGIGE